MKNQPKTRVPLKIEINIPADMRRVLHQLALKNELIAHLKRVEECTLSQSQGRRVRRNWVEALNLRGTLTHQDKQKFITISCYLGQFLLSIGTPLPTYNAYKLEIRQTLELPRMELSKR